jgi:GNAT superfamily N-acetyltransferase
MESDADLDVMESSNLIEAKIKNLLNQYLNEERTELTICFRDKTSPSIQIKNIDEFEKELLKTDDDFINKVNEISKIGTIIICYIPNIDIKIVGSGTIIYEPKIIHGGKSVGHIEDIIVDEKYRNIGIAKNILNMLLQLATNTCYKVILDCKEELVDFYSKNGFNKNGNQMSKYF